MALAHAYTIECGYRSDLADNKQRNGAASNRRIAAVRTLAGFVQLAFSGELDRVNNLFHQPGLVGAGQAAVVRPNVDTIYSSGIYDLSQTDVTVTIPPVDDKKRYINIAFYDLYGNNFANIGAVPGYIPRPRLLRRVIDAGAGGTPGVDANATSALDGYHGYVNSPTTYGIILARILFFNQSTEELETIRSIQEKLFLNTTARDTSAAPSTAPLTAELLGNTPNITSPQQQLELLARLANDNPPEAASDAANVASFLEAAGISLESGTYRKPVLVDLNLAALTLNTTLQTVLLHPGVLETYGPQWIGVNSSLAGNYGTNYALRAYIGQVGYLALTSDQALYPSFHAGLLPSNGLTLTLRANESYLLKFSGKPPLADVGFWGLTLYDSAGFLIANEINRYSLGDRSNITYPDGSRVYAAGGEGGSGIDGAF